jgi:hypothetical protein
MIGWLSILLLANALIGILLFERVWARTKRHRQRDEARDKHFPAWRRHDAPNWRKWHFYPMAVTFMPLRVLAFFSCLLIVVVLNKLIMLGVDVNKPLPKYRRYLTKLIVAFCSFGCCISLGVIGIPTWPDTNYSKWLGPSYRKEPRIKRCSTYIANH